MEGSTIKFKAFPKSVGPISDDAIRHWTKVLTKGGYVTRLRKSWLRSERVIGTKRRVQLWQDRIKQIRTRVDTPSTDPTLQYAEEYFSMWQKRDAFKKSLEKQKERESFYPSVPESVSANTKKLELAYKKSQEEFRKAEIRFIGGYIETPVMEKVTIAATKAVREKTLMPGDTVMLGKIIKKAQKERVEMRPKREPNPFADSFDQYGKPIPTEMTDVTTITKIQGGAMYRDPSQFNALIIQFIKDSQTSQPMRDMLYKLQREISPKYKEPTPTPKEPKDVSGEGGGSQKTVFTKPGEAKLTPSQQLALFGQAPHNYYAVYEKVLYPPSYSVVPRTITTVQQGEPIMDTTRPLPIESIDPTINIGRGPRDVSPEIRSPLTSAMDTINDTISRINSGVNQVPGVGIQTGTMPGLQSATITGVVQDTGQGLRQGLATQHIPALRTPSLLQPVIQPELAKIPPRPPSVPPVWYGAWLDSIRKKPRKQRIRKRRKRKLWWDVPYQPLGEPWAVKEYVVFTGGEPGKVKKKEKTKGLDDWGWFRFAD